MVARYNKTKFGFTRTSIGGTYPINNGDPQCDDDEFDEDEFTTNIEELEAEYLEEAYERRIERDNEKY
jgi:hypothetical protein